MIDRKLYRCHFCHLEIPRELVKTKSVARSATSWVLIRGGVKRQHLGVKLGSSFAHNACVEAAFSKNMALGQEELWPHV